jgi:hypothetical protein
MSSINPFSGYVAQGTQIERTEAADKKREARRTQEASQSVTRRDDELEHQVESADAVAGVHDEQQQPSGNPQQQQKKDDDEEEQGRLDVTA